MVKNTIQISATVEATLKQAVTDEAERNNRSFSEMVGILLLQSIKERERLRNKNAKKVHS